MNIVYNDDYKDYIKSFADKQFDLAVCDPPYFSGPEKRKFYGRKVSKIIKRVDYGISETWEVPNQEYFDDLIRISKNQIIWGINYYNIVNLGSGRLIWDKCNGYSSYSDCEIAYVSHHDSVRMFKYLWNGAMQGKSISEGHIMQGNKKLNEKRIHPTQKPVILYDYLFQKYLPNGGKVIDTHLGSGSIRISAEKTGNIELIGFEKNKKMFDAQERRFNQFKSQLTLF